MDLLEIGVTHIQELPFQGKDAIAVAPYYAEASHSQGFGRVTLCENQCALF